jgi:hypothetical protein
MLKKLLPLVILVLVSACANTQGPASGMGMKMSCCEKCECCKSGKCGECCKEGQCSCCKDGTCKMCHGMGSISEDESCPMCAKSEREWKARQGIMKR